MKKGDTVFFWWSASEVYSVKFVDWVVARMQTGGDDTNKLGVGALVESDWLFEKGILPRIPYGCKRGQRILRPFTDLYRSYSDARKQIRKIQRPTVDEVKKRKSNGIGDD